MQTDRQRECETALDSIDLLNLLSQYGHFQEIEGDLVGPCPYHESSSARPSLTVKPHTKEFHCAHGKCNARGSVIQLIADFEKTDTKTACEKIIQYYNLQQSFVQDSFPFAGQTIDQKQLHEYTQTPLRILRQCPLRYWNEYTMGVRLDQQLIQSTIGSLIHSALQDFFKLSLVTRKQSDLITLFKKRWGKGFGPQEERENWLYKANSALENAYNLNSELKPIKMDMEVTKSTTFPFDEPLYRLSSKADRVDWYGDTEYQLIDYKWDEKPLSENDATTDFVTIIFYLSWLRHMSGIPPKLISYQYLSFGEQVDVVPNMSRMEAGIERLVHYIEKAEKLKKQTVEPDATRNEYCYNCKLNGECPATKLAG